ncbi:DNA-formamidopyrimidine glycosylase [Anaerorhabdus sp.]|jgi:formamidopyrimidine-DNA glycosylase|uniref:DNA-formamidopyrimidine glycosylase n=1 Tax=Anaerorhabdus sp. TaxID=1872524 RepID=UPI002FCAD1B9
MPELPEVETVLRTLEHQIQKQKIIDIDIRWDRIVQGDNDEFKQTLIGQEFVDFKRRGKYLLFIMNDCILVSHLRMEGKYFYVDKDTPVDKHTHVIFKLSNNLELRYNDTRKFGRMEILPKDTDLDTFKNLGYEPWDERLTSAYCKSVLRKRTGPIKGALLDQSFIAGIGNIYADEICFKMGVDPRKACKKITKKNCEDLIIATREILQRAIECGGTTIRSYTSSLGITGLFQLEVYVHGKKDEVCPVCGTPIKKIRVATRGTYFCPNCQKR